MALQVGNQAPDFEALIHDGSQIRLSDFRGKKVVLYFYPTDDTPTCTDQACNLRDHHNELTQAGYVVIGVSPDDVPSHQKFINKFSLPFLLVSDPDLRIHHLYGTWAEKQMFGNRYMGTLRHTFVIDEKGIITRYIRKVKSKDHANQILLS